MEFENLTSKPTKAPVDKYKNVYTLLEKVKRGEIGSHYKNENGLFGKIDFYKKADLVRPHLHYIDSKGLGKIVRSFIEDASNSTKAFNDFNSKPAELDQNGNAKHIKKPNEETFTKKLQENYEKFPEHIKNDIFKMYYHRMEHMEFENRTDKNNTQFKLLEKANNPVKKVMTESSNLKSAIFARNIIHHMLLQLTMLDFTEPEQAEMMKKGIKQSDEFNSEQVNDALDDMMDNNLSKKMLDDALQSATETCNNLDSALDKESQDKLFEDISESKTDITLSAEKIKQVAENLAKINMSMGSLKEKIKKLMNQSINYFSSKTKTVQEDLFNSDNLGGLDEFTFLHPKLRKFMIEDVMINDTQSVGKINIYIDISGSMSSSCGSKNDEGNSINCLDFSKSFAIKMIDMGMVNEIFTFNNRNPKKLKTDLFTIALLDCDGGTDINLVIKHIEKSGANAIIITDAEDNCNLYTEKAFFIGVNGCRFNNFHKPTIREYSEKKQAVMFDGKQIYSIDANGDVIS